MYIKPAAEIKQVQMQWAEKIKQHLEKDYAEKEATNLKADSVKLSLLHSLSSPFLKGGGYGLS